MNKKYKYISSEMKFAYPTVIINFNTHHLREIGGNHSRGPSDPDDFGNLVKAYVDSLKKRRADYHRSIR